MPNTNFNDFSQLSGPGQTNYVRSTDSAPPATSAQGSRTVSTLSRSQQEAIMALLAANNPLLIPPNWTLADSNQSSLTVGAVAAMSIQNKMSQVALDVCNSWLENIEEIKRRREEELQSPSYKAWEYRQSAEYKAEMDRTSPDALMNAYLSSPAYQAHLASLTPIDRAAATQSASDYAALSGVQGAVQGYMRDNVGSAAAIGLVSALGANGIAIDAALRDGTTGAQFGSSFQQIWQSAGVGYQSNFAAQLGLIGALFSSSLQQFSTAEEVAAATGGKGIIKDADIAKDLARNTLLLIKSEAFNNFMKNYVAARIPEGPLSIDQRVAIVKMALLIKASATLYKAETGWITAQELKDLLAGKINLPANDPRHPLIAALNDQLSLFDSTQIDSNGATQRERVLNGLTEAYAQSLESQPSVEQMSKSNVFEGIWNNLGSSRPIRDTA